MKESDIQNYITNAIEESLTLDYKSAGAIDKSKTAEITKDVSAMANSAGGLIIYGVAEYSDGGKRYLAEKITPIDRDHFSKEWLESIIGNIRPRISEVIIHPVSLSTGDNHVAYVVEIPKGNTAHQAADKKYYRRYNFASVPMDDHEIRDVMNRATVPNISVEFSYETVIKDSQQHAYSLKVVLKNLGDQVINNFKLTIQSHRLLRNKDSNSGSGQIKAIQQEDQYYFHFASNTVFFPQEERDLSHEFHYRYYVTPETWATLRCLSEEERNFSWTLYADNMPPKYGRLSFSDFQEFGVILCSTV